MSDDANNDNAHPLIVRRRQLLQLLVGPLVVATLVPLATGLITARDTINVITVQLEQMNETIDELKDFKERGDRFTKDEGFALKSAVEKLQAEHHNWFREAEGYHILTEHNTKSIERMEVRDEEHYQEPYHTQAGFRLDRIEELLDKIERDRNR